MSEQLLHWTECPEPDTEQRARMWQVEPMPVSSDRIGASYMEHMYFYDPSGALYDRVDYFDPQNAWPTQWFVSLLP